MQILTNLGTATDYIDKAIYKVLESERKTKFDVETMKKSRKENDLNFCVVNQTTIIPKQKILSHLCLPPWSLHCWNDDSTLQK